MNSLTTSTQLDLPKAVFWDMDGTLVDTEPLWGIATYELSERMGRRLTPELREATIGGSFSHTLDICAEWAGVTEVDYAAERKWMWSRMKELLDGRLTPNPGITELLEELSALGVPMMVTTNTARELADPCIDAIGRKYFVDSIAGDEVTHAKPHPEMYLLAAERAGFAPAECLIVEDSMAGMTAAAASGAVVIGLAEVIPAGVVPISRLAGQISFEGISAQTLSQWWATLRDRD